MDGIRRPMPSRNCQSPGRGPEPRDSVKGSARALACRFRRPRRKPLPSFGRFDFHPKVGGMLRPAMKGGGEENSSGFFRSRRGTAGVSLRRR